MVFSAFFIESFLESEFDILQNYPLFHWKEHGVYVEISLTILSQPHLAITKALISRHIGRV